jgi:formate hydrogenlyase subunit 6/NADH:ubiquinone oxidoreductase subunit I
MLNLVLQSLFKKPATLNYPADKSGMPKGFRGKITFDSSKCIGCKMCVRDCPANAIAVNKVDEKRYEAVFDLRRCIYCGQCVDSCLKKALAASAEFELAQLDKNKLKVVFHAEAQRSAQKET